MSSRIVIYSPDEHIRYNLQALDNWGVGGGITARIRLAHALAARGHRVTLFINTPTESNVSGVQYRCHSALSDVETDVFIASTSGDRYSLEWLCDVSVRARLRILLAHGVSAPASLDCLAPDYVYAPSNFICDCVVTEWGFPAEKLFVCHRGTAGYLFEQNGLTPMRDAYALAYTGHPSKGLDTAIDVLRRLRAYDKRFSLHVYGGNRLWGGDDEPPSPEPGLCYHGLTGQAELARELQSCSVSLNLQARPEPFGMAITDSMRAGCVVLASPVGAFPEIVRDGENGYLVYGEHHADETRARAAALIQSIIENPRRAESLRRNAIATPLDWETVAGVWEEHWRWSIGQGPHDRPSEVCVYCSEHALRFADGLHCTVCGHYAGS